MKKSIGIVLASLPGYSETFLDNTIKGLTNKGYYVILFVEKKLTKSKVYTIKSAPTVPKIKAFAYLKISYIISMLFLFYYKRFIQFIQYEKELGRTNVQALKNLYKNSHILKYKKLDWLHFGFATFSIGKENVAKVINAKMAISIRGFDISIYPQKKPGCYFHVWKRVDKVHSISNDLLIQAFKEGMPYDTPYQIIYPAININFFTSNSFQSKNIRHSNQCINILTISRLHWKKGLDYTIDALNLLNQKGYTFEYTIIGDGFEYEKLIFAINQLNLRGKVKIFNKISHSEVKNFMERSDIYLQYSIQEGFCNAVLEAQALGLLCIVSDAEGLPENVIHGQTGWVVEKRRPDLLAQRIEKVIALPEDELTKIRLNAIERVRDQFNIEKQIESFVRFYSDDY